MFEEMLWRGGCVLNVRESFITQHLAEMIEGGYVLSWFKGWSHFFRQLHQRCTNLPQKIDLWFKL